MLNIDQIKNMPTEELESADRKLKRRFVTHIVLPTVVSIATVAVIEHLGKKLDQKLDNA